MEEGQKQTSKDYPGQRQTRGFFFFFPFFLLLDSERTGIQVSTSNKKNRQFQLLTTGREQLLFLEREKTHHPPHTTFSNIFASSIQNDFFELAKRSPRKVKKKKKKKPADRPGFPQALLGPAYGAATGLAAQSPCVFGQQLFLFTAHHLEARLRGDGRSFSSLYGHSPFSATTPFPRPTFSANNKNTLPAHERKESNHPERETL